VTAVVKILVQLDFNLCVMSCYCQGNSLVIRRRESYIPLYFYLKVYKQQKHKFKTNSFLIFEDSIDFLDEVKSLKEKTECYCPR